MEMRGKCQKTTEVPFSVSHVKALVGDECPEDLEYYSAMLEAYGCQVRRCVAYGMGLRCLGNEAFDFVIVSQGTRQFEGSCVLKRAVEVDRSLPIVVVARCLDMGSCIEAMQLGAKDWYSL